MWTAARSSRTSTMRIPSASARIQRGMMWPPQRAKMRSTPRASRKRATTPAAELAVGGLGRIVRGHRLHDGFVLVPDLAVTRRPLQHLRHRAPEVVPIEADRVGEERVAGDAADPEVEAHVRFDERVDAAGLRRLATFRDQLASLGDVPRGAPLRGQARGQRVERFPELVRGAEELALERRDDHAATPRVANEVLGLEDGQGLSHRLARDAHPRRQTVLVEARARRQPPIADRGEDRVVGLLDQRRAGFQEVYSGISHAKCDLAEIEAATPVRSRIPCLTRPYG